MYKFFFLLYHRIKENRLWAWPLIATLVLGIAYIAHNIGFEEDITQLIPNSEKSQITQKVLQTVSFSDKIVVNIKSQSGDPDDLIAFATAYVDTINKKLPKYIKKIQGKVADDSVMQLYDFVYNNLPLFLDDADYDELEGILDQDSIAGIIENNYKALISPTGLVTKKYIVKDPLSITPKGLQKLAQLQLGDNYDLYNGFLVTKDRKNLLLFLSPALASNETGENTIFIENLKKLTSSANTYHAGKANAVLFGATLYAVANAKQIKRDIQLTVGIAMSVLLLILMLFYRKITVPIIIFTPTVVGAVLAIAILYMIKGKISAISLGIGSVLLGITLDYSLHILTHFRNNRDVKTLYKDVTLPIIMSSLTTAVAFLCLIFVKSEALNDLGIFAAVSVVGASVFALIFIPQVYKFSSTENTIKKTPIDRIAAIPFHKKRLIIGGVAIVFLIGLFLFHKVGFNTDLNTMNYQPQELQEAELALDSINNNKAKSIYLVSHGATLDEALHASNSLYKVLQRKKKNAELINYSSIGGVVLSKEAQEAKLNKWNTFWTSKRKDSLTKWLEEKGKIKGFKPNTFKEFYAKLKNNFLPIEYVEYAKIAELYLDEFVTQNKEKNIATVVSAIKVHHQDADALHSTLQKESGDTIVIDRKRLNETLLGNLKNDFNRLIGYSLIAVVLLLLLFYKDLMLTFLTVVPIAITWVMTLGIMKLLDIDFNIFNVIISTFVFGLGVDYSIFITNGLIKEHTFGVKELPTYKTSILLSVITTILGVGVLVFAQHPALYSISVVSLIGILSAVVVAFTIQPMLFKAMINNRSRKGLAPLMMRQTIGSILSFAYFIIGGFLVSLLSSLIIPWFPANMKMKMGFFHKTVSKLMKSVLYSSPFVKKRIQNQHQEDFSEQCIMIANHASFLDILAVGMLHPKLIYLVKDWVYNNPVFGRAVKLAGFYPVSSGIDGGVEHLEEKVRQGYSLIAFPEGSRTQTAKMSRFHKGSFYLAEKLDLDILPVIIHGSANLSPKGDFIIHDGALELKILPRITKDNLQFGQGYGERTKKISAYFKDEFAAFQEEVEDVNYYKKALLNNYRYKSCYSAVKKDIDKHKEQYQIMSSYLRQKSKILYYGDDYGQLLIYLSFKRPYAKLKGMLRDEKKLSVAKHCYTTYRAKINFQFAEDLNSDKFNVLLLCTATPIQPQDIAKLLTDNITTIIMFPEHKTSLEAINFNFDVHHREHGVTVMIKNK